MLRRDFFAGKRDTFFAGRVAGPSRTFFADGMSPDAQVWIDFAMSKGMEATACATACLPTLARDAKAGGVCMLSCGLDMGTGGGTESLPMCPPGSLMDNAGRCQTVARAEPVSGGGNTLLLLVLAAGYLAYQGGR